MHTRAELMHVHTLGYVAIAFCSDEAHAPPQARQVQTLPELTVAPVRHVHSNWMDVVPHWIDYNFILSGIYGAVA